MSRYTMTTPAADIVHGENSSIHYSSYVEAMNQVGRLNLKYDKWGVSKNIKKFKEKLSLSDKQCIDLNFIFKNNRLFNDFLLILFSKFVYVNDLRLNENTVHKFKTEWLGVENENGI